ncbi:MAG TPA: hypothetical protein PKJ19_03190 [Flavobacteriales bacterium]|nr:hypothetical protein [Flavobacteriales bacterium]HNU56668.1 hypothetical protein [Flavobacteriales bacterium]
MITNACDNRASDILAIKREPFSRVLDQVLRWLRQIHAAQEAAKKHKK